MDIKEKSELILTNEITEVYLMILKVVSLPESISNNVVKSLLPFISLLADGIDKLLLKDTDLVDLYQSSGTYSTKELIAKSRAAVKLLSDKKANKTLKIIEEHLDDFNSHLTSDYNLIQRIVIAITGQEDFGVYYYKGSAFGNSSQDYIYYSVFLNPFDISTGDKKEISQGELIREFSQNLASLITKFSLLFSSENRSIISDSDMIILESDFTMSDFFVSSESRRNILKKITPVSLSIFLYNIQCQLTFLRQVMPIIINEGSTFNARVDMIVYYQSVLTLYRKLNSNLITFPTDELAIFNTILSNHTQIFSNKNLRGNLFHYELSDDIATNGPADHLFKTMIQTYCGDDFEVVIGTVREDMDKLVSLIHNILT